MIKLEDRDGQVIETYNDVQHLYDVMQHRINAIQLKHRRDLLNEYKNGCWTGIKCAIAVMIAVAASLYIFFG